MQNFDRNRRGAERNQTFDQDHRGSRSTSNINSYNGFRNNFRSSSSCRTDTNYPNRRTDFQRHYPMGLKTLETLLEREPYIIPLELLKKNSGYNELLSDSGMKDYKMSLVLKVLNRSLDTRACINEMRDVLLLTMNSTIFIQNMQGFISVIKYEDLRAIEFLPFIGALIKRFLAIAPMVAFSVVAQLADLCIGAVQHLKVTECPLPLQELEKLFENIQIEITESRNNWKNPGAAKQTNFGEPPDNIADHKPYPTPEELNENKKPFLRPLVIKGSYNNSKHYVDVNFRLLKEDFVRPLREGLYHYRSGNYSRNSDVRVYSNVEIHSTGVEKGEFVYYLKLNLRNRFNLENSKRLMYGNVLCISEDNFETMLIGTINNRDKIKDKIIGIKLEFEDNKLCFDASYTMLESKAYFVAYKHTLKALQDIDEVPLAGYLVEVNERNLPPSYVNERTTYELHVNETSLDGATVQLLNNIQMWPSSAELGLDDSQRRALYGAVTHQMAIIQGPPGTGKTFMGLKITELLLHNKSKWSVGGTHPILVVCFTNHALDQFLEGSLSFTKNIVRVGSRSKTEKLEEYQIKKRLFNCRSNLDDNSVNSKYHEFRILLKDVKRDIDQITLRLESLNEPGILDINSFLGFPEIIHQSCVSLFKEKGLRYFLFESFSLQADITPLSKYAQNDTQINEKSSRNLQEISVDEEIRREEEESRILHDDCDDDADDIHNEDLNIFRAIEIKYQRQIMPSYYRYESTSCGIESQINDLEAECFYLKENNDWAQLANAENKIGMLRLELRTIRACKAIEGTDAECKILETRPVLDLNFQERWKLYNSWKKKLKLKLEQMRKDALQKQVYVTNSLDTVKELAYLNIMKKVDIVGMTTTGAAQYCHLLHDLAPPIVIVEEAAEILEAHVVSALSTKCEHLILIGDHLQLRPKPNVFELGTKYNLATSLFERMIKNDIRYESLEFQHRMKPMFSNLLVPTIYENLKDHPSVFSFPKIKGVEKDLFFLDHSEFENKPNDDIESFENRYEAEFLMGLCRHLVFQGYSTSDVTIIAPYSGQFRCLKELQRSPAFSPCVGVRISILDNYQGEESNIILLSLVRSNAEENVGFVKTENRICVALSRARHGMYIIGNMAQMVNSSSLWDQVKQKLINGSNFGSDLELVCQNHPDVQLKVKCLADFNKESPQGGCTRPCSYDLPVCGHRCTQCCHVINMDHKNFKCLRPCTKTCDRGHACIDLCFKDCSPCPVTVEKVLPCTHSHMVQCGLPEAQFKCPTKIDKMLPDCKHVFNLQCCIDISRFKCTIACPVRLDCGHKCKRSCHASNDPEHEEYNCDEMCEKIPEGCEFDHPCNKECFIKCGKCTKIIDRRLKCGHTKKDVVCSFPEKDMVCRFKCKRSLDCGHHCPKYCGEECGGCNVLVEKVVPQCLHKIKVKCSVAPSVQLCTGQCMKILPCGHRCKNKCKVSCVSACQELVPSSSKCPRGHSIKIPCHLNRTSATWSTSPTYIEEKTVGEYCVDTCGASLSCKHICQGKCGECLNGRLHAMCKMPCKKTLVCGHVCKAPCSEDCPPCQDPCAWKCSHSACKKKCGILCVSCKEKCERKCPHSACSKKCGDKCDRQPCDIPCPLKIKTCGHPCIGLCGEPCPTLCRICDKERVTEIVFGNEDEPDAKFILLEDCNHVLESTALEQWMSSSSGSDDHIEIGMKRCPLCQTAIYNTRRFHSEVLQAYDNVLGVKRRHFTVKNKFNRNALKGKLIGLGDSWSTPVYTLRMNLGFKRDFSPMKVYKPISDRQATLYTFQVNFLEASKSALEKIGRSDNPRLTDLVTGLMTFQLGITHQTMDEFNCELRRLEVSISVEKVRRLVAGTSNSQLQNFVSMIDVIMDPSIKFVSESESKVIDLLKQAEKFLGSLGITQKERLEIVNAMGLKQGHWYKCPNGHIYCIADCGGAVMETTCPECNARIGGFSHRLRSDNQLATEMDGASRSAWPTGMI